ncbi:MAG: RsmB/NOP family class I SAM-dependent RNA methyltransferase [Burkholderiales bacterium]|nr:RsmB/NOP family class I SAM-dependent RNA methyltransferase [Burkholderiales bacterium]
MSAERSPQRKRGSGPARPGARGRRSRKAPPPADLATLRRQALARLLRLEAPADAALRAFFREHPSLGRRDRGDIAEAVFDVLRHRRLYAHLAQSSGGPIEERLLALSQQRRAGRLDTADLPFAVRYSLPDWLAAALLERHGPDEAGRLAAALLEPAPVDLRINTLKADLGQVRQALTDAGIEARPLGAQAGPADSVGAADSIGAPGPVATPSAPASGSPLVIPNVLRLTGKPALERSAPFEAGWIEVQDAGSQLLALLVAPRRGQTVVDLCAGAGGKTLAMAAAMRSTGQIYACDISVPRLLRMRRRLERSGASNVQPQAIADEHDPRLQRLTARADAVLVDAPCSGTGTLRRNPDLKWRMTSADVARLASQQRSILAAAAQLVRPGGCLVYATCSLLRDENEARVAEFEAAHPDWRRRDAGEVLRTQGVTLPAQAVADGMLALRPDRDGCDGFFAVRWERPK